MIDGVTLLQRIRVWSWTARLVYALTALIGVNSLFNLVDAIAYRGSRGAWFFAADNVDPLYELGTSLGFWGMLLFCINFVLATRWRWVERLSGGLDKVYQLHAFVGKTATSLLVLHLAFLLLHAIPDLQTLAAYTIPGLDVSYTLGMLGLLLLVGLVIVTIWYKLPYEAWLKTHTYMGVAYILGGAHALVAQQDWYIGLLTLIGGYAWWYSRFGYRRHAAHVHGSVVQIRHTQRITELVLRLDQPFAVSAGQFVFFGVTQSVAGLPNALHPFSVSQCIDASTLRLSVKAIGDYTSMLPQLRSGDRIVVYGPHGMFGQQGAPGGHQIWVAGGIGITPFLSMIQAEVRSPRARAIHLVWAVRQHDEAIYAEELARAAAAAVHIVVHIHVGTVTAAAIEQLAGTPVTPETTVLLCGPVPMMRALRTQWQARGVPQHQIISEEFGMR
jgi:predicted ferric reductase